MRKVQFQFLANAVKKLEGQNIKKVTDKTETLFEKEVPDVAKMVKKANAEVQSGGMTKAELQEFCLDSLHMPMEKTANMSWEELNDMVGKHIVEGRAKTVKLPQITTSQKKQLMQVQYEITMSAISNMDKYTRGLLLTALHKNFDEKRARLLAEMREVLTPEQFRRLESAKTPEKMQKVLYAQEFEGCKNVPAEEIETAAKKGKITLEMEQIDYADRVKRDKFIMARERALAAPSQNQRVVEIENILKEKYGVKFVNLKDSEVLAENVLKGFETAAKSGAKLPENVVVSDFMFADGEFIPTENMVLFASYYSKCISSAVTKRAINKLSDEKKRVLSLTSLLPNKCETSTKSAQHLVVHEIMHGQHPFLAAFAYKKIPASMQHTKENLSLYSAVSQTHETYTELRAKQAIEGLNERETELLNYLS